MSARTTVVTGAIILAVALAGTIVIFHHPRQAPLLTRRVRVDADRMPPVSPVATEAVHYLHQLRIQGQLPGFTTNEQCIVLMPGRSLSETNYPITLEFRARKRNVAGPFSYHFQLIKASADSGWRLQKAWRTDEHGNVAEELPLS